MGRAELDRSLTIRLSARLRRRVVAEARRCEKPPSDLVREILEREVGDGEADERSLFDLTKEHVGSVSSTRITEGRSAREALLKWAPDRRG